MMQSTPFSRLMVHVVLLTMCFLVPFSAYARLDEADQADMAGECSYEDYMAAMGMSEGGGKYDTDTGNGMTGKYQFAKITLRRLGFTDANNNWNQGVTRDEFLRGPNAQQLQDDAIQRLHQLNWGDIQAEKLDQMKDASGNSYISQYGASGLMGGCHLLGCNGFRHCLDGSGPCTDKYGTDGRDYMKKFANYDLPVGPDAGANGCAPYEDNGGPPRSERYGNPLCAEDIQERFAEQLNANFMKADDLLRQEMTPPESIEATINGPCFSKELQKVTNQFSNMGSGMGGAGVNVSFGSGPVGSIMNNFFRSGFKSINDAAKFLPQMLNFQSQVSGVLGNLLSGLGAGGAGFDDELCGMMMDTLVKFVQCQVPLKLPNMGNMTQSLNFDIDKLLPTGQGCAGNAMRDAAYAAAGKAADIGIGQPLKLQNGKITAGSR